MKKIATILIMVLILAMGTVSAYSYSDAVDSDSDGVGIAPTTLYEDESIQCVFNTTLSTAEYTWYKNGYEQTSRTSSSVSSSYLDAGDQWRCKVTYEVYVWYGSYGSYETYTLGDETVTIQEALPDNTAPVLEDVDDVTKYEGETVSVTLEADDAEGDDLEFALFIWGVSTSDYSFNSTTGQLTWETQVGDADEYLVSMSVTDGEFYDYGSFTITIEEEPEEETYSPYVSAGFMTIEEGESVDFDLQYVTSYASYVIGAINNYLYGGETVYVYDSDSDVLNLTYEFTSPLDSEGDWTTEVGDAGSYTAYITITDSDGNTTTDEISITVTEQAVVDENECPLVEMPDLTVTEGDYISASDSYTVSDPDGDILIVSFTEPLENNGNWQTEVGDAGEYDVTMSVTDGDCTTEVEFTITVETLPEECTDSNGNGVCDDEEECPLVYVDDVSVAYGESALVTFTTEDAQDDPLALVVTSKDFDDARITFDEATLTITIDTEGLEAGDYEVSIFVSDGQCDEEYNFTLTVEAEPEVCVDVNENGVCDDEEDCPVVSVDDVSVTNGETAQVTITATDAEGDNLTYEASSEEFDSARITVSNNHVEVDTEGLDAGSYTVNVVVSDGQCDVEVSFVLTVEAELVITESNVAPVLEDIADIEVDEGETVEAEAIATDADGDELTYTFEGLDDENVVINDNELVWLTDCGDAGLYTVTVTVSDGELSDSTTFEVKVNDVCDLEDPNTGVDTSYEGDLLSVTTMYILNANNLSSAYDVSGLDLNTTGVFYVEDGYLYSSGSDNEILLYLEMENRNSFDAENLELTFVIEGVEYYSEFQNLSTGAKGSQTYSIAIPADLESGKYHLTVYIENEDIEYKEVFNFEVTSLGDYVETPEVEDPVEPEPVDKGLWSKFVNWVNSLF
jgi:hypothetical protein